MLLPPSLADRPRVHVVAPSGPFDLDLLKAGIARLEPHCDVFVPPGLFERRDGFLAGTDDERARELRDATESSADVLWIARGGYGIGRILSGWDPTPLVARPRLLVGFSDATSLHLALAARGVASVHGPNLTTLANAHDDDVDALLRLIRAPRARVAIESLRALSHAARAGHAAAPGPLVGGNLTVLVTEAAAGRLVIPPGALLFLEDVTETSYRVDRMLSALADGGYFQQISGLLLGDFTDCSAGKWNVSVESVLEERLGALPCPVYAGLPVGHGARNRALLHGVTATLDGSGTLSWGESSS